MQFFENESFYYRANQLFCENVNLSDLATEIETPVYIYSKTFFKNRYLEFSRAFSNLDHKIFYAVKSNFNLSVIKTFIDLGSGLDINSEGEFYRALLAGAKPENIILTGLGKTYEEIKLGVVNDVLMIKAESLDEIILINEIASKLGKIANVAIRVNPDVNPQTHPYISTGLLENKFGLDEETALGIYADHNKFKSIRFTGIDMHIGSQITSTAPFEDSVEKLSETFFKVKDLGIDLHHFDIGGGFGNQYLNEKVFSIQELANKLFPLFNKLKCKIFFEPGRFLTANGGIIITKVIYNKCNKTKNFIVVDLGMNDLLRPSIYTAYHHIQPLKNNLHKDIEADIVGPVCESGDFMAKNRTIELVGQGEYLAVMSTGAYGTVMSSNYNARRRPAEIMIENDQWKIVRSRESFEHLVFDEKEKLQ